jgi:hypothetical protein
MTTKNIIFAIALAVVLFGWTMRTQAQSVVGYPMAWTVYSPVVTASGVVTTYPSAVTAYYPSAVTAYSYPAYTSYSYSYPAYPAAVTAWRPVVAYSPAVTYPVVTPTYVASPVVATGPAVWVNPKVYVEEQPVRNLIRAITP